MQKVQILFPDPDLRRLRQAATEEDRAVSEIVRRATEAWLDRRGARRQTSATPALPLFDAGRVLVAADSLREAAWADRELTERTS